MNSLTTTDDDRGVAAAWLGLAVFAQEGKLKLKDLPPAVQKW